MRWITIGCTGAAVVSFFAMENLSPPPGDPYRYPTEMFAPVVLPFQLTVAILAAAWIVGALLLRRPKGIGLLTLGIFIAFIPSCTGVMMIVDSYRYGRFDYDSTSDIPTDGYIELPQQAVNITLYRNGAGHYAHFNIDTEILHAWIGERRALRPELNSGLDWDDWAAKPNPSMRPEMLVLSQELFASRFPDTDWKYDPSMIKSQVTRSQRGGGYTVWHTPSTGDTYLSAGYW